MSTSTAADYVHGYSGAEAQRLRDQASALDRLLHHDTLFDPPGLVLEVGCGTGAQTVIVARQNAQCRFVSLDISRQSLTTATQRTHDLGLSNVTFEVGDVYRLPFHDGAFDHVFVCFLLEHLSRPTEALRSLRRVLKPGGSITVIEGDHGSAYYHPRSDAAQATIRCLIDLQAAMGGNSLIGRELYPLLVAAGFHQPQVEPRVVYADGGRPEMADYFTRRTFTAMVEGVRDQAIGRGLIPPETWEQGIRDLHRTAEPDGTFSYTFFKARALKE